MKLSKIKVYGFKSPSKAIEVRFAAGNTTVIYGANGCGKTTLLKLINATLAQNEALLKSEGVSKIEFDYCDDNNRTVCVTATENAESPYYDWSEFEASSLSDSSSITLGVERGISTKSINIDAADIHRFLLHNDFDRFLPRDAARDLANSLTHFIRRSQADSYKGLRARRSRLGLENKHVFLQNINMENIEELLIHRFQISRVLTVKKIQNALFDTLAISINNGASQALEKSSVNPHFSQILIENKKRIIEALSDDESNNFKQSLVRTLQEVNHNNIDQITQNRLLVNLFSNMISELEDEKVFLSSTKLLVDKFNEHLTDGKKVVLNHSEIFIETPDGRHSIAELSSGERHLLTFLAVVLIEGQTRNFLIIDEPEISLNIKWQRGLMPLISELVPNTQVIVASHSPIIAKHSYRSLAELVTTDA